jgi:hypothetical protein
MGPHPLGVPLAFPLSELWDVLYSVHWPDLQPIHHQTGISQVPDLEDGASEGSRGWELVGMEGESLAQGPKA